MIVLGRKVNFVFPGNVLDSDTMVEDGDPAEANAAEADEAIALTD
jgi:hypothetical protein